MEIVGDNRGRWVMTLVIESTQNVSRETGGGEPGGMTEISRHGNTKYVFIHFI